MESQAGKTKVMERRDGSSVEIRRAKMEDLDAVWGVVDRCSKWLVEKGHHHWRDYYSRELMEKKLATQTVYLAARDEKIVGTVTIDENPVSYYTQMEINCFELPERRALYVTTLAVDPDQQGKGTASDLMRVVEEEARSRGIEWIRFDCKSSYLELVRFYKNRGYKAVGVLTDEEDNNEPYSLMEKRLR